MSDFVRKSDVLNLLYGIFDKYKMSTDKNTSIGKSFGTDVFEEIRNMPTAYDIDKVVEELEKLADENYKAYCIAFNSDDRAEYDAYTNAIEIVKQGGVSDDVCEWKLEDEEANLYLTGCQQRQLIFEGTPKENGYRYCQYCRKKIKVVE